MAGCEAPGYRLGRAPSIATRSGCEGLESTVVPKPVVRRVATLSFLVVAAGLFGWLQAAWAGDRSGPVDVHVALPQDENIATAAAADLLRQIGPLLPRPLKLRSAPGASAPERDARTAHHLKQDLLAGKIDAALLPASAFLRQSALFGADQIPFLNGSIADADAFAAAWQPVLARRLREHDLTLLALVPMRPVVLQANGALPTREPGSLAVADGASRRLAELARLRAVADGKADLALSPLPRPGLAETSASDIGQALALAGWPHALLIVRADTFAGSAENEIWQDPIAPLARAAGENTRALWAKEISRTRWGKDFALLGAAPARPNEEAVPAGTPVPEAALKDALIAASRRMAQEWAIDGGADGLTFLRSLGIERAQGTEP